MTVKVHGFVCGWLEAPRAALIEGAEGEEIFPVPAYLIEHAKGTALFDSGLAPLAHSDPVAAFGAALAGIFKPRFLPGEEISARIAALGHDPARVDLLINSHLHFDHCGGNALAPNATLMVQRKEWEIAGDSERAKKAGLDRRLYDLGQTVRLIDGEHDIFGDGSAVLLPTYGHTAGHQSLRVRTDRGETILTADCCYFHATLEDERLPGFAHDRDEQIRSIRRLRAMRDAGARLVCGHDRADWAQATAGVLRIA